jgi:hypothetical protein
MDRPLFEIAAEIAKTWDKPSPQARTFLKAMHYLVGMDDTAADIDADRAVRFFLQNSKDWTGITADRIKSELQRMRSSKQPTNRNWLASKTVRGSLITPSHCALCEVALSHKYVEGHARRSTCAAMCVHCNLFLGTGLDRGDGALYLARPEGGWVHVHGQPNASVPMEAAPIRRSPAKPDAVKLRYRIKRLRNRVFRKLAKMAGGLFRRIPTAALSQSRGKDSSK